MGVRQQRRERRIVAEEEVRQALMKAADYIKDHLDDKYRTGIRLGEVRRLIEKFVSPETAFRFKNIIKYAVLEVKEEIEDLEKVKNAKS